MRQVWALLCIYLRLPVRRRKPGLAGITPLLYLNLFEFHSLLGLTTSPSLSSLLLYTADYSDTVNQQAHHSSFVIVLRPLSHCTFSSPGRVRLRVEHCSAFLVSPMFEIRNSFDYALASLFRLVLFLFELYWTPKPVRAFHKKAWGHPWPHHSAVVRATEIGQLDEGDELYFDGGVADQYTYVCLDGLKDIASALLAPSSMNLQDVIIIRREYEYLRQTQESVPEKSFLLLGHPGIGVSNNSPHFTILISAWYALRQNDFRHLSSSVSS